MQRKRLTTEDIRREVSKRVTIYHKVFSTPDGQKVLEHMRLLFCPEELYDDKPHKMHYMAGQRDVVTTIDRIVQAGKTAGDDNDI